MPGHGYLSLAFPRTTIAEMIFAAATDHIYLDAGHIVDFANKAFELLDPPGLGDGRAGAAQPGARDGRGAPQPGTKPMAAAHRPGLDGVGSQGGTAAPAGAGTGVLRNVGRWRLAGRRGAER